jgi:carbonic anhydrase
LDNIQDPEIKARRMVELNVIEQVQDLGKTSIVQNAWKRQQPLHIHGWVYEVKDGLINDLNTTFTCATELHSIYQIQD